MVYTGKQILGISLAFIGFLGSILTCVFPAWKVTAFIGANIVTAQVSWEGLWMVCVTQSTGQMQCKVYNLLLALSQDLQAARLLVVIAIIAGVFGMILAAFGSKCTNFVSGERQRCGVLSVAAGIIFMAAGLSLLIPVCWSANTIIRDFYNPLMTNAQRRELGISLYTGWGAAGLLFLGGGLLCSSCGPRDEREYAVEYVNAEYVRNGRQLGREDKKK